MNIFYVEGLLVCLLGLWKDSLTLQIKDHLRLQGARCTSRCLQNLVERNNESSTSSLQSTRLDFNTAYDECIVSTTCHQCLLPCSRHFAHLSNCMEFCRESLECQFSCAFFNDLRGSKMGFCSAPAVLGDQDLSTISSRFASNNRSTCSRSCFNDFNCPRNEKCCRVGCGTSCLPAFIKKSWVPPLLNSSTLNITERRNKKIIFLNWSAAAKQMDRWTIYVIQEKRQLSIDIPAAFSSGWETIRQTPDTRLYMLHLKPGYWYKFRVAAVNVNGTKGFASTLKPFKLSASPSKPSTPIDLSQVRLRITTRGRYNVQIKWSMPTDEGDLPVKGFYVSWFEVSESGSRIRHSTTRRRYIKASQYFRTAGYKFWIAWVHQMRFDLLYNISVAAASGWKNNFLFSKKTYIQAMYPPNTPKQQIEDLKVDLPFKITRSVASVNVSWTFDFTEIPEELVFFYLELKLEDCVKVNYSAYAYREIAHSLKFTFFNISLNCRYQLTVQAMYGSFRQQWSKRKKLLFYTPPCGIKENRIATSDDAVCIYRDTRLQVPRKFVCGESIATSTKVSVQLHWLPPIMSNVFMNQYPQVVAYFIYAFNSLHSTFTWTIIRPETQSTHILKGLKPNTLYSIHLAAIYSNSLAGPEAITRIQTGDSLSRHGQSTRVNQ